MITFKTRVHKLEHLSGHYLNVPATIVKKIGGVTKARWVCKIGDIQWQCGLVAHKKGGAYILLNQKLMKQAGLREGSFAEVQLTEDKSKFGMTVPKELKALFAQDKEGKERFEALVPGKRRYIIYYVNQVMAPQLRGSAQCDAFPT